MKALSVRKGFSKTSFFGKTALILEKAGPGPFFLLGLFVFAGTLCSCLGSKAEIVLQSGGSGKLNLEYRISRQFQSTGALDGNARWPSVPVDRADLERSVARLNAGRPGAVKLQSFSVKEDGPDLLYRVVIGFSRLEDILPLLDYAGEPPVLVRGERQTLVFRFAPGTEAMAETADPELLALAEEAFRGYEIAVSLSAPSPVGLRIRGGTLAVEQDGRKAGFSVPVYDLITGPGPVTAEFEF
jgi:hypothetical protein